MGVVCWNNGILDSKLRRLRCNLPRVLEESRKPKVGTDAEGSETGATDPAALLARRADLQ